jgi:hypothetical protein
MCLTLLLVSKHSLAPTLLVVCLFFVTAAAKALTRLANRPFSSWLKLVSGFPDRYCSRN